MGREKLAGWSASYRSALRPRDVRLLFSGLLISSTGSWAYSVGLLAFVFARTHSLGWVGAAGLVRLIPALLLSIPGGVIADRRERIGLLVGSDVLCALWQVALAVVAATGGPPALALFFVLLTSASATIYQPATAATIPSLVDEDSLAAANALNDTVDQLVVIAGPAIGAVLLVLGSPAAVFAVNAGSFAVSAILVSRIATRSRPVDAAQEDEGDALRQLSVGIRAIVAVPAAFTMVLYSALVSFLYGTDTVLFVGVSAHRLGTGARGFGYLLAGLGIGGLLAAAAVDRLSASRRLGWIILGGTLGYALPTALLVVVHAPWLAFVIQVVRGAATLLVDVLAVTALQRAVAPDRLARVFGVFWALIGGSIALGTVVTPAIVGAFGLNAGLWTMAVGPALVALAGLPALRRVDRETEARVAVLAPRVVILEQLGIFATASRPILERLAGAASQATFAAGEVIVAEGDRADALYVLVAGEVRVTARGESGAGEQQLRTMSPPSLFGEIGILEGIPRTANVTAMAACHCLRIDGETLLEALSGSPPSSSLMENARARLALTHPSRKVSFAASPPAGPPAKADG
jgi:MFS family permease